MKRAELRFAGGAATGHAGDSRLPTAPDAHDPRPSRTRRDDAARALARDPALWAWIVVGLLALLPLRAALTASSATPEGAPAHVGAPAPVAERVDGTPRG